ncbi:MULTISPECIES: hypothetical protein [Halorussus]|uniref:hypothetical protein n=1 Tax=Halorussus TaxID=1070314 RepID=UPI00209D8F04|nr:hypothetical protein [Halorussus vallis]USZ77152.1 hypothetical protein NGM07_07440 [Halorussus vallis]
MRVLFVPELYRPDDATANGTLEDAVQLVDEWLDRDPNLHVYWLLAPPEAANYDPEYVHADRERVTLVEAEPFMAGHEHEDAFSETGYTEAQLRTIEERIYDRGAYVDAVVDQHVTGRYDLYKWLHRLSGGSEAAVQPVELVGYVHDLRLPFKRHGRGYPNDAPTKVETAMATFVDDLWFKAGVDADRMREYAGEFLDDDFLDDLVADALETGSPLDFSAFEESYADEPETLHVAGSGWRKKNLDVVLDAGETLYEEFGIRTLMTNMDPIPDGFAEREFVDAYPECSKERYRRALDAGDLAICASDHETMARTPFEQAASGQVLLLRDRPWIYDCAPDDYRLTADLDDLESLAVQVVQDWEAAVEANHRLVAYVTRVRDPERCGRRTYERLRAGVGERVDAFEDDETLRRVDAAVAEPTAEGDRPGPVALGDLSAAVDAPVADLVYGLRSLGYADDGSPGEAVFRPADA